MTVATTAITEIPLDMAPNSFDDQYQGCGSDMKTKLPTLNRSELQRNSLFAEVWPEAVKEWHRLGSPLYPLSYPEQAIAIMAYTMNDLYEQFNNEVRVAGRSPEAYRDKFHFKTLHFLLTDALATLKLMKGQKCECVFRGVKKFKFKANVGDTVRFGQFASSSRCEGRTKIFGTTTTFVVRTCYGAYIEEFSYFDDEEEVLIPPFEKFKVTKVIEGKKNVRIHLNSIGIYSKYNCELLRGGSGPKALAISGDSSWSPQLWQGPQGSSKAQSNEDICGHCKIYDSQDHQDTEKNKATKATTATTATMAALAAMASMWSLWPPLAL
ncbi:erythroblast NAD(P)(+)--arginine ADP-ribosyltransferase-like isoform X2 [Oenanthe melanoleuca]|nr:erythroblast NAD(P)(+)--arginine ADP-ribosyltransferase-like isoform X2 [Oenanthe melanoleuca]